MSDYPTLGPSGIGEAVNHGLSPWYIKLRFEKRETTPLSERNWPEALRPLSALQSRTGQMFESDLYAEIEEDANRVIDEWSGYDNQWRNEDTIRDALDDAIAADSGTAPTVLEQVPLSGEIESFDVVGDADLIIIWPTANGAHIRVFDIKSSWDEKTYQQIQTACYTLLLEDVLRDDDSYTMTAGIMYRETDIDPLEPKALPSFTRAPREQDVTRLLREEGPFATAFDRSFEEIRLDVDSEAPTSPFGDLYAIRGVENESLSLIGLSRGEQRTLAEYDITTLEEMAALVTPPDSPKPYDYDDPEIRREHRKTVRQLEENHAFSERIPVLAQRAQAMLGGMDSDHPDAHDKPWTPWLKGVGETSLPEDDPTYDEDKLDIEPRSMIRVYLNVQYDYVRDRVYMVSATIDCSKYDGEPLRVSHCIDDIDYMFEGTETDQSTEEAVLETAVTDMFDGIQAMSDLTGQGSEAPVHFYVYTADEQETLTEALKRHPSNERLQAMRDLFGLREGIDQAMVSVVQPEIEQRLARKQPNTGLLPMVDELSPRDDDAALDWDDWTYERDDGMEVDLRSAFNQGMFDDRRPYVRDDDGLTFQLERTGVDYDGYYSILPRHDAQMPLEYVWSAIGMFTPEWSETPQTKSLIENYRWVDGNTNDNRIIKEDIEAVGERLALGLRHIERSLVYRDPTVKKQSIQVSALDEFTLGEGTLSRACREYLDLEYYDSLEDALDSYKRPAKQRILSGESVPFRITDIEDYGYMVRAEGELIYDAFTFENPEQVASASKISGSDAVSSGSFLVATPLELTPSGYETDVFSPSDIEHSTPATVQQFDPSNNHIVVESYRTSQDDDADYSSWYKPWTVNEREAENTSKVLFEEGKEFILDKRADQINADKATVALDHAESNTLYNQIDDLRSHRKDALLRDAFEDEGIQAWLKWVDDNLPISPNEKQQQFITEVDNKVSLLQGPPGTGKTSGALAHAILGRAYGYAKRGQALRGLVTGASNKAVDEVMDDVAEIAESYDGDEFEQLTLVRLVLGDPPEDGHENVEYVNYNDDEAMLKYVLKNNLTLGDEGKRQSSLDSFGEDPTQPHTIVFGTPGRVQKMAAKMDPKRSISDRYADGDSLFDMLAVDEASMLPLHQLFMCSAFVDEERGQTLLAGDQRQMPPVQSYAWEDEDRRIIETQLPHLSTLNYFRFLRGDPVDRVEEDIVESPNADIPIARLERTYRCHTDIASFLQEWVYKQDGIDYTSDQTATIPAINGPTEGITTALDADQPLTVLIHDDRSSRQSNHTEATIASALANEIPDSESIGIVTPHNAQKGLLARVCDDRPQIDTVERFQGGERDVMILSATVSDPDYLEAESDFILSPNRLNVALSRMKKKLVVIAPRSLFELIPSDVDEYSDAIIWKGLYDRVDADGASSWEGSVQQFAELSGDETNVEVHQPDDE